MSDGSRERRTVGFALFLAYAKTFVGNDTCQVASRWASLHGNSRLVGNPSLIALRQSCSSYGQKHMGQENH
jgi:hypothetical protein